MEDSDGPEQASQSLSLIKRKLVQMQESVEVYERMNLKAEYLYAYRMLIFLLLQSGEFNALARELTKFLGNGSADGGHDTEGIRIVLTKLWNGQSPNDEREKGVIIRCGDGLIGCGLDKVRVFQQCVVPALKEFYMADADSRSEALSQADIIEKLIYKV